MATKEFQKDIWIARDLDESLWGFFSKPEKNENGDYFSRKEDPYDRMFEHLCNKKLTDLQEELNLTNIEEPYKIKVTIIFEDLPDVNKAGLPYRPETLKKAANVVREYTDCLLITKYELSELKARIRDLEQTRDNYLSLKRELKLALEDIEIE